MAASRDRVSSSSSSEDDKEIQRLKEAAWSFTESNGIHDTIIPGKKKLHLLLKPRKGNK